MSQLSTALTTNCSGSFVDLMVEIIWLLEYLCEWDPSLVQVLVDDALPILTKALGHEGLRHHCLRLIDVICATPGGESTLYSSHGCDILSSLVRVLLAVHSSLAQIRVTGLAR